MGNEENKAPMAEKIDLTPVEVDPSLSDEAEFGKPDNDSKSYGMFLKAFSIIAALLALFHLYTAQFGILTGVRQRAVHLTIVLVLTFMIKPANRKKQRTNLPPFYDFIFMLGAIVSGAYMYIMDAELSQRSGTIYTIDVVMGVILILLILEACRRLMGWALPIVALVMIVYAFFGQYFPGLIAHPGYSLRRIIGYLFLGTEGVFGTALNMSSTVIAIFICFWLLPQIHGNGRLCDRFLGRRLWPCPWRSCKGRRYCQYALRLAVRQRCGKCGGDRLVHHSADEARRLRTALCWRGGGCGLFRRTDHAAGYGRDCVRDLRYSRYALC